jgi:hypothetical protein
MESMNNQTPNLAPLLERLGGVFARVALAAAVLAIAYGFSIGIFFGQIANLCSAPPWLTVILALLLTYYAARKTVGLFGVVVGAGLIEQLTGSLTASGIVRSLLVTAISVLWTLFVVHLVKLDGFWAAYVLLVWNGVVFLISCMICSGVNLLTRAFSALMGAAMHAQDEAVVEKLQFGYSPDPKRNLEHLSYRIRGAALTGVKKLIFSEPDLLIGWGFFTGGSSDGEVQAGKGEPFLLVDFPAAGRKGSNGEPGQPYTYRTDEQGTAVLTGLIVDVQFAGASADAKPLDEVIAEIETRGQLLDKLSVAILKELSQRFTEHKLAVTATMSEVPSEEKFGSELRPYVRINFVSFPGDFMGHCDDTGKRDCVRTEDINFHVK